MLKKIAYSWFIIITLLLAMAGCKGNQVAVHEDITYKEDLSKFRPTFEKEEKDIAERAEVTPTEHDNQRLEEVLDSLATINKNIKHARGYRIQIYTGNSRDNAMAAKSKAYKVLKEQDVYLTYKQPTFRVQVGDFLDHFEAQKALQMLQSEINTAFIVETQVNLPK